MRTVTASEARAAFSRLLAEVERGDEVTITRRGVAVAKLMRVEGEAERRKRVRQAIEAMKEFRKGNRLDGLSVKEMINDGRRI